jgi:outer membrane protein OmpA-like peptidoglycan-associated protein
MKRTLLYLSLCFLPQFLIAQDYPEVQWASKVLGVSSELSEVERAQSSQYKAEQVLGKPNKLPDWGQSYCAWSPSKPNNPDGEWIKVGFEKPMKINQIVIAENHNPGAISKVAIYDVIDKEYVIFNNPNVGPITAKARMFSIMHSTDFEVRAVKIFLSSSKVLGYNQIDAIGISESKQQIIAKINVVKEPEIKTKSKPENLGFVINSEFQEIAPTVSPDGKTLYFTRSKHPSNMSEKQDVWYAEIDEKGNFKQPQNIGKPINNNFHNSSFSISPDGNKMLLNNIYKIENGELNLERGLSVTTRQADGNWSFPVEVRIDDFMNKSEFSEYCLSQDGKILLMTVQRADSKGGKDIYFARSKGDGTWSQPISLGDKVNTAANETSPFLASDGKTLYFSTSGFSGYGSNDIYVSRRLDETWTNWSEPQNLGPEINTPEWDAYFSITAKADYAYFTSYDNSMGDSDIFRVKVKDNKPDPVALIKGNVYNKKTGKPIEAKIVYEILPSGDNAGNAISNGQTGAYKVVLPLKKNYGLLAEAKGFISVDANIDLSDSTEYVEITQDLYLVPIEEGMELGLNNIFFPRSQWNLLPESFPELNRIAKAMQDNPSMKIQLEGHTEVFGKPRDQYELALNRVKSVKSYLVRQGIDENRIKTSSKGGREPVTRETSEEARAKNRRVVMKILHQ